MLHSDPTAHGGELRRHRCGRKARPLSTRKPIHLIFKSNYKTLRTPRRFMLVQRVLQIYAVMFYVKLEQVSIQGDHVHLMIRTSRRSNYQAFFRVVAGQIPQRLEKLGLFLKPAPQRPNKKRDVTDTPKSLKFWRCRPFTRIIRGRRDFHNVRDYIQLNELEALGRVKYRPLRLKGLSSIERFKLLWEPQLRKT